MGHVSAIRDHASGKAVSFLDDAGRTTSRASLIGVVCLLLAILICVLLASFTSSHLQTEIDQRIGAEEELRNEQAFVNLALDSQSDTFFVFEPQTGRPLRWNKAFRDASGYSDAEIDALEETGAI